MPVDFFEIKWSNLSERVKNVLWKAGQLAVEDKANYIRTDHIARALIQDQDSTAPHQDVLKAWLKEKAMELYDRA